MSSRILATLAILAALIACESPVVTTDDESGTPRPFVHGAVTDHVIVVSIDGLRPDAIETFGARTLLRLMREGSYSLQARTILPSITLPAHTSMLTGTTPDVHGVTWNDEALSVHGYITMPTIFAYAHAAGFRVTAFFSKPKFLHLMVPGTLDYATAPGGSGTWSPDRVVDEAQRSTIVQQPNLLFVHMGEPDFSGHEHGWMSRQYGEAVRVADAELEELLTTADRRYGAGNYTIIVSSDHGGHDHGHGSADPLDVTIPWIVWGQGVQPAIVLPAGIRTMDTAATALWLLGIPLPAAVVGRPVLGAFTPSCYVRACPG
jgi:predicted AlkP superfamily pyrophosphatase or phosphodiesterase